MGSKVKPEWNSASNPRIEPGMWQADITKAKKILDWQPRYNLEEGLKKDIGWFRQYGSMYSLRQ
jgi:nucleoside-diphosphate-sugar epimerase